MKVSTYHKMYCALLTLSLAFTSLFVSTQTSGIIMWITAILFLYTILGGFQHEIHSS